MDHLAEQPFDPRVLNAFATHLPHTIWSADAAGNVDYLSRPLRSAEDPKGTRLTPADWLDAIHPEDREHTRQCWQTAVDTETPYRNEARCYVAQSRSWRWHLLEAAAARDPDGRIRRWFGSTVDIHERKTAEEALRISESRLRAVYDAEPECVKLVSASGLLIDMNPAGLRMIEADNAVQVLGHPVSKLVHPEDVERFNALHQAALEGQTLSSSFRLRGLKGTQRWVLSRATPMPEPDGTISAVLSITHDATDRWREEQLKQLESSIFESISTGAPLNPILQQIVTVVERLHPTVRASVLLVIDDTLRGGAAPSLPDEYNAIIDGLKIGEAVGSCGTAAFRRRPVEVADIALDPLWSDFRETAAHFGLRACWSYPVLASDGQVLATFALYPSEPGLPGADQRALIDRVGRYVRLAIERTRQLIETRESEARYRSIFNLVPVSIWEEDWSALPPLIARFEAEAGGDLETYLSENPEKLAEAAQAVRVLSVNDSAVRMFEARDRAHLTANFDKIFAGERASNAYRKVLCAFARGETRFEAENELTTLGGKALHLLVRISLPRPGDEPMIALISEMDITDLRRADERFRTVALYSSDLVWEYDPDAHKLWLGEPTRDWFGHSLSKLSKDLVSLVALVHPEDRERILGTLRAMVDGARDSYDDEFRILRADGSIAHVHGRGTTLAGPDGRRGRLVGSIVDVTEKRQLEKQLSESQRLESIGRLTGGIAHDFNNLLTVILGNSELLVDRLDHEPRLRDLAEMCGKAALRGAELTNRLLAFARKQPLAPKPVEMNRLIKGLEGLLRRTIGGQIDLEVIQGGGLWKAMADTPQLESALLNLCINARDAMPEGGKLTLETANAALDDDYARLAHDVTPGQYVVIAVSDTGIGMDAETIARAFEPFFTTKAAGKGSGLGLSMVYGFAKQSRGHVRLYSEPGLGTTVKLYLPRVHGNHEMSAERSVTSRIERGAEHILMVEDDDLVRAHVEGLLKGLGYTVTAASNGQDALKWLESDAAFDLLFTDVVMPGGMSGRQLADHAAALRPSLPVLFTSGYTENSIVHHGRLDPGVELLQKPYRRQSLAAKLRKILDKGQVKAVE